MAEGPNTEQSGTPKQKGPTAETIGHLKHLVDEKKPAAAKIFNKSGTKPTGRELVNAAGELLRKEMESETDPLTGLRNLQGYTRRLAEEVARANTYKHPLTIAVLDANGLKQINDTYGHKAGDEFLIKIAKILTKTTRETDVAARPGGDEFNVILPETDQENAALWKERVDAALQEAGISVSIGLNQIDPNSPEESIKIADQRMYEEKRRYKERNGLQPK